MSDQKALPRPRQVTTAVVMAIVVDLVMIVSLFDTLGRTRTPEMRAALDGVLGSPPGSGLGVTTAEILAVMRVLLYVGGALGAVALVFAVFVLQRHRAARVGYTVTAALLLLTVPAVGLLPVFVALAAIPLWSRAARDWYAGRAPVPADDRLRRVAMLSQPPPPPAPEPVAGQPPGHPDPGGSDAGPSDAPPASPYGPPPYGQAPFGQAPYGQPGQPSQPAGYAGWSAPSPRDPDRRPVTVTVAAVLTWVGAGATAALMLAFVAILAVGGDSFVNELDRATQQSDVTLTADQAMAIGWTIAAVFLFWSVAAIVLAVLAFRRSNAGRIALVVSAALAALLSLVSIMSGLSAITLLMAGAVVVLLFTGGANQWYSRRPGGGSTPPGGTWGQPAPYPVPYQRPTDRPKPW